MVKKFADKVILITGAASGLGQAAATEVAGEEAKLSLVDINPEALEKTKQEILKKYPHTEIITIHADVSDEAAVKNYVEETVKAFGRIDGFYNNAWD